MTYELFAHHDAPLSGQRLLALGVGGAADDDGVGGGGGVMVIKIDAAV